MPLYDSIYSEASQRDPSLPEAPPIRVKAPHPFRRSKRHTEIPFKVVLGWTSFFLLRLRELCSLLSGWLSPEMDRQFPHCSLQSRGRRCCTCAFWPLSTIGYLLVIFSIPRYITSETLDYSPQRREYRTHELKLKSNLALASLSSASAAPLSYQLFFSERLWELWYYRAWTQVFNTRIRFSQHVIRGAVYLCLDASSCWCSVSVHLLPSVLSVSWYCIASSSYVRPIPAVGSSGPRTILVIPSPCSHDALAIPPSCPSSIA